MSCRRGLLGLVVIALAGLTACSSATTVYKSAGVHQRLQVQDPVDRVWRCLLHGRVCQDLQVDAEAAVVAASDMVAAQWARAVSRQVVGTIGQRATAWLDLLLWLELKRGASLVDEKLRVVALEAVVRLAVRDRRAVVAAAGSRLSTITDASTRAASPEAAFRIQRAVWRLFGRRGRRFYPRSAWPHSKMDFGLAAIHPRLHTGVRMLRRLPALGATITLASDPDQPLRYHLPADRPGTYAGAMSLPAAGHDQRLILHTSAAVAAWLGGTRLHLHTGESSGLYVAVVPASSQAQRLVVAVGVAGGGGVIEVGLVPVGPSARKTPAGKPDSRHKLQPVVLRSIEAMWAPEGPSTAWLRQRFSRGPLLAMLRLHRKVSLSDYDQRAGAATLDDLLSFFPGCTDARIERAARARDDGDVALARQLLEGSTEKAERDDARVRPARMRSDLGLELARQALGEGMADVAMTLVERLAKTQQGDCAVQDAALDLALEAMDRPALDRLLALRVGCAAPSLKVADALLSLGRLRSAAAELSRAATIAQLSSRASKRAAELAETTATKLPQHVKRHVPASDSAWREVQHRLVAAASGGKANNPKALDRLLLASGAESIHTRRGYYALGGRPPWRSFFHDGAALVEQWRKKCPKSEAGTCDGDGAPMTWVLDQEIDVLLPSGGALRRVHQIIALHTAKAAESLGELQIPPDAQLVLARTHGADGRLWLPASTPDKESVSLRNVVPGAVVEYVQVQFVAADDRPVAATRLPVFMLASTAGPVRLSELVLLTAGKPVRVPADASPHAPTPDVRDVLLDSADPTSTWRTWVWRTRNRPRVRPEPRTVRASWTVPAVRVRHNARLRDVAERFEEVLAAYLSQSDPALVHWVNKARAAGQDSAKWRRLIKELAGTVAFARSGTDPGSPATAARDKKGDRATLLWYIARKAGVSACLARWQPLTKTPAYGAADPRDFSASALRLTFRPQHGAPRMTWIDPGVPGGVLDYLRPGLRGRNALLVGCGAGGFMKAQQEVALTTLPDVGARHDRRKITMHLVWNEDGSARAEIKDRMAGALAELVRGYLGDIKNQPRLIHQLARTALVGWDLQWRGVDALDAPEKPLVVRYVATLKADVGSATKLELGLFPARLARIYARLHERRTALRFGHALDTVVQLYIDNRGVALEKLPDAISLRHARAGLRRTVQQFGTSVVIRSHLQSHMGIVPPTRYTTFAKTLRAIDRAEVLTLARTSKK